MIEKKCPQILNPGMYSHTIFQDMHFIREDKSTCIPLRKISLQKKKKMQHWFALCQILLAYFELTFSNPQLPEGGQCGQALDLADALSHEDQGVQAGEPVHVDDAGVPGEEHLQLLHRRLLPALYLVVVEAIVCTLKE